MAGGRVCCLQCYEMILEMLAIRYSTNQKPWVPYVFLGELTLEKPKIYLLYKAIDEVMEFYEEQNKNKTEKLPDKLITQVELRWTEQPGGRRHKPRSPEGIGLN